MRYSPCWQLDHKSPNQPLETLFLDVTSTRSRLWLTFCCRPYVYAMHSEQPDIYGHKTGPMSTDVSTLYLHKRLVACLWKACSKGTSKMFVWRMTRSVCSSWTSLWGWLTELSASSWMDSSRWNCTAVSTSSWSGITVRTHTHQHRCVRRYYMLEDCRHVQHAQQHLWSRSGLYRITLLHSSCVTTSD